MQCLKHAPPHAQTPPPTHEGSQTRLGIRAQARPQEHLDRQTQPGTHANSQSSCVYRGYGPGLSSLPAPLSHDLCVCSGATPAPGRPQMLPGHAEELWEPLSLPDSFPFVLIHPSQAWKCPAGGQSQACPRDPQPGMSFALRREGVSPLRSRQGHPRGRGQAFSWWVGMRGAVAGPRIAAWVPGAGWALLSLRFLWSEYQQGGSLAVDQNLSKQLFLEHWLGPCDSVLFGLC